MSAKTLARIWSLVIVAVGGFFWLLWQLATGRIQIEIPANITVWLEANLLPAVAIFMVAIGLVMFGLSFAGTKK